MNGRARVLVVLTALACLIPSSAWPFASALSVPADLRPAPAGPWPAPLQDQVNFSLTAEGIPHFAGRPACSLADANMIAYQFALDGADTETQQWAVYIASREAGCDYRAVTKNAQTRDDSHCTFQLNVLSGTFAPTGELGRHGWTPASVRASMRACADAASDLWTSCGRGPWTPPYSCRPSR